MCRHVARFNFFLLGLALIVSMGCDTHADVSTVENQEYKAMADYDHSTADSIERKRSSMAQLQSEGIPAIEFLPVIEGEAQAQRRTTEEIAYRAMSLLVVAVKAEGLEQPLVDGVIKKYGLAGHFSPEERLFLENAEASEHDRTQFVWRYEAAYTLLWALGYVDKLEKPSTLCDPASIVSIMHVRTKQQFMADARLRPLPEILDQADLIYRYHWAVVDARLNERLPPSDLDPDVTMERHYALNWLIQDVEWDDVRTDT